MLMAIAATFVACQKDEPYKFKSYEQIYLNGIEQPKFKGTTTQYTVAEIVRNPHVAILNTCVGDDGAVGKFYRHFPKNMRDTVNNRLLMLSTDILTEDGRLADGFINSWDVYFAILDGGDNMNINGDTVGYIPQSVIDNAREQIEALYAQERYDEIYELFHTAFVFYPCTGEEYKQIVKNGGN